MPELNDRVCVVTGASSGIGAATARTLASAGARVVVAARRTDRLDALVDAIGPRARAVACDVTDRAQVQRLIEGTKDTEGRLDVLVSNAGIMPLAPMARVRMDDWDRMIDVNIKGLLYGIGFALPIMIEQGDGHLVNVSSVAGRKLFAGATVYCGTKHAVHAISEGLREELSALGKENGSAIRVTVIAPGVVLTELHDSVRDPETAALTKTYYETFPDPLTDQEVADSILYAVSAPRHVNVNEILLRPIAQVK